MRRASSKRQTTSVADIVPSSAVSTRRTKTSVGTPNSFPMAASIFAILAIEPPTVWAPNNSCGAGRSVNTTSDWRDRLATISAVCGSLHLGQRSSLLTTRSSDTDRSPEGRDALAARREARESGPEASPLPCPSRRPHPCLHSVGNGCDYGPQHESNGYPSGCTGEDQKRLPEELDERGHAAGHARIVAHKYLQAM